MWALPGEDPDHRYQTVRDCGRRNPPTVNDVEMRWSTANLRPNGGAATAARIGKDLSAELVASRRRFHV